MVIKKRKPVKKKVIIAVIVALIALGIVLYIVLQNKSSKDPYGTTYAPATKTEKKESEENKERIVKEQETDTPKPPTTPDGLKAVTPVISTAEVYEGNLEISSLVPGILEDGGTCTTTLTKGSQKIERQTTGIANVSNVQCPGIAIPVVELSKGTWNVTVTYASSKAKGTSENRTVEVK